MKKFLATITALLGFLAFAFAAHITGGEMLYEYLGPGLNPGTNSYRILLKLFRDNRCTGCAAMPTNVFIGIFNNDNGTEFGSTYSDVPKTLETNVPVDAFPPCVNNAPIIDYDVAFFNLLVELPINANGWTAAYQTCCRVNPLVNVLNSNGGGGTGSTYICTIPGTNQVPLGSFNNSPRFFTGISLICFNKSFSLNFSAEDPDGDSLSYNFCEAFGGGPAQNANTINPAPPPYGSVPYINGFSADQPLGQFATIDPRTGIISGVAPDVGKYVVCVCINEYRNGLLIGNHRKDFIVNVASCDFAGAKLLPAYSSCDGFTDSFENLNNSVENHSFLWDFGITSATNDTSNLQTPTFTYPDTGVYILKLVVNRGEPCSDSAYSKVSVFPGFFPGFISSGVCVNKPTRFTDTTRTVYGVVDSWRWDFGVFNILSDTSRLQNPVFTYSENNNYNVRFIVSSSKGCLDTVFKLISIIDKPPLTVAFKDTLICTPDAVQLQAIGDGTFTWTPIQNIINANTATPTVNPANTTKYFVELDDNGCKNHDSVTVRVVSFVTLRAMPDTTICAGDPVQLGASTDGLRFQWTPATTLDDPTLLNPVANPLINTTYQIRASIGSCSSTDDVAIRLVPYPGANAGSDTIICYQTVAQLHGRIVGASFVWSPASTLNNPNILNPFANPFKTTSYILTAFDTIGCPKPGRDTVLVTLLPKINAYAGNDTSIIVGQPLQLQASGGEFYLWSPSTGLSSVNISNPVMIVSGEIEKIRYRVTVSNAYCSDSAFINVKVFKTNPQIFVPTAFTPNGDGLNDMVRPIAVGIKSIEYFSIYNRWGQLVFTTSINGQGWDGRISGKLQGTNAYVWLVKAIDYLNRPYFQKGTVTLIR